MNDRNWPLAAELEGRCFRSLIGPRTRSMLRFMLLRQASSTSRANKLRHRLNYEHGRFHIL